MTTTDSDSEHPNTENLLNRDFSANRPGKKWVSDFIDVRTKQGWLYMTIIMDLFDRKIIGWSINPTVEALKTVIAAFQIAWRPDSFICNT